MGWQKDGGRATNAASCDGELEGAGKVIARPRIGRSKRRRCWMTKQSESRCRKRVQGSIRRRQLAWAVSGKWQSVAAKCRARVQVMAAAAWLRVLRGEWNAERVEKMCAEKQKARAMSWQELQKQMEKEVEEEWRSEWRTEGKWQVAQRKMPWNKKERQAARQVAVERAGEAWWQVQEEQIDELERQLLQVQYEMAEMKKRLDQGTAKQVAQNEATGTGQYNTAAQVGGRKSGLGDAAEQRVAGGRAEQSVLEQQQELGAESGRHALSPPVQGRSLTNQVIGAAAVLQAQVVIDSADGRKADDVTQEQKSGEADGRHGSPPPLPRVGVKPKLWLLL